MDRLCAGRCKIYLLVRSAVARLLVRFLSKLEVTRLFVICSAVVSKCHLFSPHSLLYKDSSYTYCRHSSRFFTPTLYVSYSLNYVCSLLYYLLYCRVGVFFSPLLAMIVIAKYFLMFYVKKVKFLF